MEIPTPPQAVVALAAFVRQRLTEVGDVLAPLLTGKDDSAELEASRSTARQFAMVIVGAAAPFAPTSYARARLLRQMHASGLLTEQEADQAGKILDDQSILGVAQ